jgi:hypothetical protein
VKKSSKSIKTLDISKKIGYDEENEIVKEKIDHE